MNLHKRDYIQQRVFIVGCPRSGTTLLQSMLATHTDIFSFPESHFFTQLYPSSEPKRRLLKIASRRAKPNFLSYLDKINASEYKSLITPYTIFQFQYARCFIKILDTLTYQAGKHIWLEKTPDHLHFIDKIQNFVDDAKFIHIIRDGAEVVASLYEVARQNPQYWRGDWSIDSCIRKWISALKKSESILISGSSNHLGVKYDALVKDTENQLKFICDWLTISFQKEMVTHRQNLEHIVESHETWKKGITDSINSAPRKKFNQVFTPEQQDYILKKIEDFSVTHVY